MNKIIRLLICIQCIGWLSGINGVFFTKLENLKAYAQTNAEYVPTDNDNWLRPSFRSFYKKKMPNFLQSMWMKIGFHTKTWNNKAFVALVRSVVEQRRKYNKFKGEFAERYTPQKNDQFVIWGDLCGAFHSLVRDLSYLHEQGIINDNLKIKPPYFFIFNGNVIDGSPYVLETLALVFQLQMLNPERVFYTRGYDETEERWQNFELMNAIKMYFGQYTSQYNVIIGLLSQFFQSLPVGLYVTQRPADTDKELNVTIISSNDYITKHFNAQSLAGLFNVKKNGYFYFTEERRQKLAKKINLKAFITGEDRAVRYHLTDGLTLMGTIEGATRWLIFSSPTERNQKLYKFHFDAFAQLTIANGMDDWTIALFHQKIPELKGFSKTATYNLVTGHTLQEHEGAVSSTDLFFASTMDLSKGASPIGKRVEEGLNLAFLKAEEENALPHINAKLTTVNDEYTPQKTRAAIEDFIKRGITLLIGSQGSASLESYLDLIEDEKILVMFPFTGAPEFRKPNLSHLVHYRGSYIREGEELIRYALKDLKARKIAIFYQDDAFGRGALEGARRALKEAGISNFLEVPHERNVVNYAKQAAQIQDFNPDTILFSTNALPIRGLIRQMGVQYFAGKNLLGLSVYEDAFERFLKDKGLSFTLIRMVPDPRLSDLPIAKEYREWVDKHNYSYDKVAFEQFINANILFEILRHIEKPVTKEKIIAFVENMKNYPFKGLVLNFNPETRELSDSLWIDPGSGEWIKKVSWKKLDLSDPVDDQSTKVRFGSLVDLSKGVRAQGRAIKAGIDLRIEEAYAKKIQEVPEIKVIDDSYDPAITRQKIEKFISMGVNVIVCPMGSPTLASYLDLLKKGLVAVLFPITGAPFSRESDLKYIINLRASYTMEGEVLAQYALEDIAAKKIVILYQNDVFGKGLLDAAHHIFQLKQFNNFLDVAYERNELAFTQEVKKVKEFEPDTILFFSTATVARNFIRQLGMDAAIRLHMLGNSDMSESAFINFVKDTGLKFVYLNAVPNPEKSQIAIVKQYRTESQQRNIVLDPFSLEAYIGVDILLHVLQSIGAPVTKEKIIDVLTGFKNKEYKGLILNFDPSTRTLLHTLWLNTGTAEWKPINVAKYNNTK